MMSFVHSNNFTNTTFGIVEALWTVLVPIATVYLGAPREDCIAISLTFCLVVLAPILALKLPHVASTPGFLKFLLASTISVLIYLAGFSAVDEVVWEQRDESDESESHKVRRRQAV